MATLVIMPRQGQSVESCILAKLHKQKGDKVEIGDLLFSYETDKASFEEEAKVSGTFLGYFFEEGDDVPCLTNVCAIGDAGESVEGLGGDMAKPADVQPEPQAKKQQEGLKEDAGLQAAPAVMNFNGDDVKISPRARNLAEKTGIDYRYANASGPYGRIMEKDIIALKESGYAFTASAHAQQMAGGSGEAVTGTGLGGRITTQDLEARNAGAYVVQPQGYTDQPMYDAVKIPNIRKVIAKAMHNSLASTAQLTLNSSFDATEIMEYRKKLKAGKDSMGLENITINDMILFAVSRTLLRHKDMNANLVDDTMLYFRNVNLGVAVDTERGLMVPTLMNANLKSLNDISGEVKALAKECQAGSINPDMLKNGSFTVTNLGSLGIESFTPVLNPPQTGILGVNAIVQRIKEADGGFVNYPAMTLSLTFDHRAVDGAPAARFLQELVYNLENFSALLAR